MVTAVETAAATGEVMAEQMAAATAATAAAAVTRPIGAAPRPTAADGVMATGHRRMRAAVIRAP